MVGVGFELIVDDLADFVSLTDLVIVSWGLRVMCLVVLFFAILIGCLFKDDVSTVAVLATAASERRETSPSIDLFFSIVYNYSIWVLN